MKLQLHVIQNFTASNLNRDDTGAPKDVVFGGFRRARISSQAQKRAARKWAEKVLGESKTGVRTADLGGMVTEALEARGVAESKSRVGVALMAARAKLDDEGQTKAMIFVSPREVELFADFVQHNWDALDPATALVAKKGAKGGDDEDLPDSEPAEPAETTVEPTATAKKAGKAKKAAARPAEMEVKLDKDILNKMKAIFDAPSMDISLFGRFMADRADFIVDAACQVAHALGVSKIEREFDFFTAMDDRAAAGSGQHLGVVEFNAPTYYRYAVIDTDLLLENLKGDKALAREAVKVFLEALAKAIPTGKQNSFAAHNMPAFVAVVARTSGAMNLANAFEQPLRPRTDAALTTQAVEALLKEDDWVATAFGSDTGADRWAYIDKTEAWTKGERKGSMTELASWSGDLAYGA